MRAAVATTLLALSASAFAQYTFDNASAPFALVVDSSNPALDNHVLSACHEGAAIEGLCLGPVYDASTAPTYTFNSSTYDLANPPANGGGAVGIVIYQLPVSGLPTPTEPEGLTLVYNPISNLALPFFEPGTDNVIYFSFDADNKLNLQGVLDNGNTTEEEQTVVAYNWQICTTFNAGYSYTALAWIVGGGVANNPTCSPVNVTRVF